MKKYPKQFIIAFALIVFCPTIVAAKTDLLTTNFCTNLATFNEQMMVTVDQKASVWNSNIKNKLAIARAEGKTDQVLLNRQWQKDDAVWEERFASLEKQALTPADQLVSQDLKTNIQALIKARRAKVATALTIKNQAKEKVWINYLTTVNQTVTNFKTELTSLFQEAQTLCLAGKTTTAKEQFSAKRQNLSKSLATSLNQSRDEAKSNLQNINTNYEVAVNQAWDEWRSNLVAEQKKSIH